MSTHRQTALTLFLCLTLALLSGCVYVVVGSLGALGGYAVTRDTIQGEYDAPYADAWKSAVDVCTTMGIVTSKDESRGVVEAQVDRAKVKVEISAITPEATRVKVKARKGIFPRMGTAEKVFVRVVQRLM